MAADHYSQSTVTGGTYMSLSNMFLILRQRVGLWTALGEQRLLLSPPPHAATGTTDTCTGLYTIQRQSHTVTDGAAPHMTFFHTVQLHTEGLPQCVALFHTQRCAIHYFTEPHKDPIHCTVQLHAETSLMVHRTPPHKEIPYTKWRNDPSLHTDWHNTHILFTAWYVHQCVSSSHNSK